MNSQAPPRQDASARWNKLELVERLADDLAHEIKNPLHSMVINLEVLRRRAARGVDAEDPDVTRYIDVLAGELDRVGRRVDLLLQLARPAVSGSEGGASLDETIGQLEEILAVEGGQHRVSVEMSGGAPFAEVAVTRAELRQLLLNVVLHAVDRARPGGAVRLRTSGAEDAVRVEVEYERSTGEPRPARDGHPLSFARESAEDLDVQIETTGPDDDHGAITLILPRFRASGPGSPSSSASLP